ncbi:MAG: metalloregulator ArsR/SmtB family transcription factor [Methanoregula sp.]|nr:MAG: metalloregulator ArsR/SmtB family transcription factor [Methanoregula sp.]
MTRPARSCCGPPARKGKKKESVIPDSIQSDLDRIGGIKTLAARLPKDADLKAMSRVYRALSDPLRLKILYLIKDQPLCVCVIKEFIHIADSKLSYHLTILREAGLIKGEYHGNWIIYNITETGRGYVSNRAES